MSALNKAYEAIVIGTSAGGFQALSILLEKLPSDYPLPIAVVQHRSRDSKYLFEEVLQSRCRIKIKQVDEKEVLKNGFVYIAPSDYHLLIETDGTFSLSCEPPVRFSRPSIDVFFESAALAYGDKLVGIILTGASDDGAAGISAICKSGGMTIAQDPDEAQYPYMVRASINTGCVHYVWSLATIRSFLLQNISCP